MAISVIVPTLNEEIFIGDTLRLCGQNTQPKWNWHRGCGRRRQRIQPLDNGSFRFLPESSPGIGA